MAHTNLGNRTENSALITGAQHIVSVFVWLIINFDIEHDLWFRFLLLSDLHTAVNIEHFQHFVECAGGLF